MSRPRLLHLLAGRFDHRITTVTAAAGFGKTTALALAIENNRLDPYGRDVWLGARSADDDPAYLLEGLARALGLETSIDNPASIERICDRVWADAPQDVVIAIDDAHHLNSTAALEVITDLVEALPANGHILLSSRHRLDIPLGRLRAHGQLLEVTEQDLGLDDSELRALTEHRGGAGRVHDLGELPRHAATADLQLLVGASAGSDFLWEEVLSGMNPDRLFQLQRAAVLEEFDNAMVSELTDGAFNAEELVDGLPLVEVLDDGACRLHAILRDALTSRLTATQRRKATAVAAEIELARSNYRAAIGLFLAVGDLIAVRDIARASVLRPAAAHLPGEAAAVLRTLRDADPPRSLLAACEMHSKGLIGPTTIAGFRSTAELARQDGDAELEAAMLYRLAQATLITHDVPDSEILDRLDTLAQDRPQVRALHSHILSILLQFEEADNDGAAALIDDYDVLDINISAAMRCERLFDLGRMEDVDQGLSLVDPSQLPTGTAGHVTMALWLRGEFPPEIADQLGNDLVSDALRNGGPHFQLATLGATTMGSLAAGNWDAARARQRRAGEIATTPVVGQSARLWASVVQAAVATTIDGDEAAAAAALDPAVTGVSVKVFPYPAFLICLPMLYVLQPAARPALDSCGVGPALATAIASGRAVVALREHDDIGPAASLPWSQSSLLRNNILPSHLAELACAALVANPDDQAARDVLEALPHLDDLLSRTVRNAGSQTSAEALRRLGNLPTRPQRQLDVRLLGPVEISIDGTTITANEWVRRPRVRELLAFVIDRGRVSRDAVIDELWPGHHDEKKTLANLRSTLTMLNHVLEPGRTADAPATFIRAEDQTLIASESITTDVGRFEAALESARTDDQVGLPARALENYLAAIEIYRGDFVDDVPSSWAVIPRLRLQSNAVGAMCRAAELLTAKGEPEAAMRLAERVRTMDPYNDRSARLLVTSLAATGTISAARAAADHLLDEFRQAGIEVSRELQRAVDRIDPTVG